MSTPDKGTEGIKDEARAEARRYTKLAKPIKLKELEL
jgi:hypothetical protein